MIRRRNLDFARNSDADFVVIEIPLLFESDAQGYCDYSVALNVSRETLQKRALKREKMTQDKFEQILNSQLPTEEKLRRADFVIDNEDEHDTVSQVKEIIGKINERNCT
jgi:dephospho-CoA kinase